MGRYKAGTNVPKEERDTLVCIACKQSLPHDMFYREGKSKAGLQRYSGRCRKCYYSHAKNQKYKVQAREKQNEKIQELKDIIDSAKQKCCICGYDRCKRALEFHHKDPNSKSFGICEATYVSRSSSKPNITPDELRLEMCKCVVLCSNCHREHHDGMLDLTDIPTVVV